MSRKRSRKKPSKKGKRPPKPPTQRSRKAIRKAAHALVDKALVEHYGELSPIYLEPGLGIEGPDLLDGVRAYVVEDQGPVHYHLVTYGLSKSLGFELTFRVAKGEDEEEGVLPPQWAMLILNTLTMVCAEHDAGFAIGQRIDLNGPLSLEEDTALCGVAFVDDPLLKSRPGLDFVQVLGLSGPEFEACAAWDGEKVLALLLERLPTGVTDLHRECLLSTDAELKSAIAEGAERDGSSQESAEILGTSWSAEGERLHVTFGAAGVSILQGLLRGRTARGRAFKASGAEQSITLSPGESLAWSLDPERPEALALSLSPSEVERLLALAPERGVHEFEGWRVEIVPTQILNEDDEVMQTIG